MTTLLSGIKWFLNFLRPTHVVETFLHIKVGGSTPTNSLVLISVVSLLAISCSTPATFKADPLLIRPYRYSDQSKESYEAPYVAIYQKLNKTLAYVAADHTDDLESSTFKTIEKVFRELKPQAVVIEGVEYTGVFSPPDHSDYARKCAKENFKGSSESTYAVWLALQDDVPFVPGEPQDKNIASELEKTGYKPIEYYYFDLARIVPQWRRTKRVNSLRHFQDRAPKFISGYFKVFEPSGSFKFDDFSRWYQEKSGKPFEFEKIDSEEFSPQVDRNPTPFNRMAHEVGTARERHILSIIEMLINRFDRVLVVYGAGHLVKERDALDTLFGTSKDVKYY